MANKENIRKWVEALRSGQYQQTTKKLSDDNRYCCLGVACEVALQSGVELNREIEYGPLGNVYSVIYDGYGGELPEKVANWLGLLWETDEGEYLPITDPKLTNGREAPTTAIELNDAGTPFNKIADLIEARYLKD